LITGGHADTALFTIAKPVVGAANAAAIQNSVDIMYAFTGWSPDLPSAEGIDSGIGV
jgi:hypothetical protein